MRLKRNPLGFTVIKSMRHVKKTIMCDGHWPVNGFDEQGVDWRLTSRVRDYLELGCLLIKQVLKEGLT